jgi:Trp operon repressor
MKENIETLSTKFERSQIEWRRSKVAELDSQGHSQPEISCILQVSIGTVNRDLSILIQQAKDNIKKYIDDSFIHIHIHDVRLPEEYEKCMVGLNAITKEAWNTAQTTEDHLTPIRTIKHSRRIAALSIQQQTAIAQPQNFDSPYIADYEKHQPWLQQVIETSVYPLLDIIFISQRAYSAIPGEYGAIAAGFVSSYMIGAIYFSPLALDIKQFLIDDEQPMLIHTGPIGMYKKIEEKVKAQSPTQVHTI